ncbi:nucleotide-binding universal stress UspA family protein [Balneicella halophila]|uniref:Nucleotide-binding universal stress UspA family protein n=1 Tax=Balneicella halophila TaxID=1537566 RepID=A0A7L4USC6_BALHA|nr:universal stress protein [Balneicella halophila]PVX52321.1 nucleotide-binding universal stress UspA family protein [Balneicella halophila]
MKKKKTIIVAYDFTERGDNAMDHALIIGNPMQAKIVMLHIYSNDRNKPKLESRLENKRKEYTYDYDIEVALIKGNLASSIKQYAEYSRALLVIIGTKNPLQGFERIFGGQTLKIVMGGIVPFLVVRDKPHFKTLKKIVIPISFDFHNKQKLRWVRVLSNYFNIRVELFVQNEHNIEERADTKANYLFAKRYLDRFKIHRKTTLAPKGVAFRESLIEYTHRTGADILMIMTSEHLSLLDHLIGADEEFVIGNEYKIPVMCVNPRMDLMQFTDFF